MCDGFAWIYAVVLIDNSLVVANEPRQMDCCCDDSLPSRPLGAGEGVMNPYTYSDVLAELSKHQAGQWVALPELMQRIAKPNLKHGEIEYLHVFGGGEFYRLREKENIND